MRSRSPLGLSLPSVRYAIWKLAKTPDKDSNNSSNNDNGEGYFAQTNNKNPILHLITRSVKQKAKRRERGKGGTGRNKVSKRRLLLSHWTRWHPFCTAPRPCSVPLLLAHPARSSRIKAQGDSSILLNLLHFLRWNAQKLWTALAGN